VTSASPAIAATPQRLHPVLRAFYRPCLEAGAVAREVGLASGFTVREVFYIWKPAERVAF